MSVIIRLQNLPLSANSLDIRTFFQGLSIPDGGVHIVGGREGDAFIAFSSDEDARQAMVLSGQLLKDSPIKLLLSSRNEMFKVIEQTRQKTLGFNGSDPSGPAPTSLPMQQGIFNITNSAPNKDTSVPFPSLPPASLANLHRNSTNVTSSLGSDLQAQQAQNAGLNINGTLSELGSSNLSLAGLGFHPGLLGQNVPGVIPGFPNLKLTPQQQQQQQQQLSALNAAGLQGLNPLLQAHNPFALAGLGPQNPMTQLSFPSMMPQGFPYPQGFPQQAHNAQTQAQQLQQLQNATLPGPFGTNPNIPNSATVRPMGLNLNPIAAAGGSGNSMLGSLPTSSHPQNTAEVSSSSSSRPTRFSQAPNTASQLLDPFGISRGSNKLAGNVPGTDFTRGGARARSPDRKDSRDTDRRRRSRSREKQRESRFTNAHRERSRSRSGSRSRTRNIDSSRGNTSKRQHSPHRTSSTSYNSKKPLPSKSTDRTNIGRDERRVSSGAESNDLIIDERVSQEFPAVQLTGVANEATFRDIRDFIREEIRGGYEGVVRDYNAGVAYVRLDKSSDYIRVARKSGKQSVNICGTPVRVDGIPLEKWEFENLRLNGPSTGGPERRRSSRDETPQSRNINNTGGGPCTLVITGLPIHYSGQDVFKITLGKVDETLFSDIHVHEESRDTHGLQSATAFVKFFQRHDAERACEIVSDSLKSPYQKVRVGEIEELIRIRDNGRARPDIPTSVQPTASQHHNQFNGISNNASNEVKPLFDIDAGDIDPESATVLMKSMPYKVQDREIYDFFSDLGLTPVNVKIVQDAEGTRNGQVVVDFQNHQQALRACSKNGMVFGRFPIFVNILPRGARPGTVYPRGAGGAGNTGPSGNFGLRFPNPSTRDDNPFVQALNNSTSSVPPPRGPPPMRGGPPLRGRGIGMGRGRGGGPRGPSRFNNNVPGEGYGRGGEGEKDMMGLFERPGCVLAVTNIPFSASMDDMLQFFGKVLNKEISRGKIIRRYNEHQKPTGDARIAFDNAYEASEALSLLQGSILWNRPLSVSILNITNNNA